MKKRLIITMAMVLMFALVAVGCNKDKTEETPTTEASEKVSTTEPTTKFEVPEIKDEPTTEETTEATTEPTTKKPTYSSNSGSSSGSSNSGSSSKPASTTKASSSNNSSGNNVLVTNANGGGIYLIGDGEADELKEENIGSADDFVQEGEGTGAMGR